MSRTEQRRRLQRFQRLTLLQALWELGADGVLGGLPCETASIPDALWFSIACREIYANGWPHEKVLKKMRDLEPTAAPEEA